MSLCVCMYVSECMWVSVSVLEQSPLCDNRLPSWLDLCSMLILSGYVQFLIFSVSMNYYNLILPVIPFRQYWQWCWWAVQTHSLTGTVHTQVHTQLTLGTVQIGQFNRRTEPSILWLVCAPYRVACLTTIRHCPPEDEGEPSGEDRPRRAIERNKRESRRRTAQMRASIAQMKRQRDRECSIQIC